MPEAVGQPIRAGVSGICTAADKGSERIVT